MNVKWSKTGGKREKFFIPGIISGLRSPRLQLDMGSSEMKDTF